MNIFLNLLALLPFYLLGCFPSGIILARASGVDLTTTGSGNVGATNVARTLGKKAGLITLAMDIFKGALAVFLARQLSSDQVFCSYAGTAAVFGHCFSIPGKLKGGKGVATAFGVILALNYLLGFLTAATFAATFFIFKIVSLASITAAAAASIFGALLTTSPTAWYPLVLISLVVVIRHHANLNRLVNGTEPKFSSLKK